MSDKSTTPDPAGETMDEGGATLDEGKDASATPTPAKPAAPTPSKDPKPS